MTEGYSIRRATVADLDAITGLYDTYIVDSHVSFDDEPWSAERRRSWWEDHQRDPRWVVLVAEDDDGIVGTSYASEYRAKSGYRRTVETSVVLAPAAVGRGLGTALYRRLLDEVTVAGAHRAVAVIALPNDASVALHHRLGFRDVGVEEEVGYKLGRYWSTLTLIHHLDG